MNSKVFTQQIIDLKAEIECLQKNEKTLVKRIEALEESNKIKSKSETKKVEAQKKTKK
jgi:hypothetical protein